MYKKSTKRIFDLFVAVSVLIIFSPFILLLYFVILWQLGYPAFFSQQRPGLQGRSFTLYKFRSMTNKKDAAGNLLPDSERLTHFGKFLRSSSLDELPELWNVIKGEMSLVGPRPLLMDYLPLYTVEQMRRHEVRPGITGWAQINGRNTISWETKFEYDVWYVDNLSFSLDLKILWLTLYKTVIREGINQVGQATSEKFTGSRE